MHEACTVPVGVQKNSAWGTLWGAASCRYSSVSWYRSSAQRTNWASSARSTRSTPAGFSLRVLKLSISLAASGAPARWLSCSKVSWRTVPNRWACNSTLGSACSMASSVSGAGAGAEEGGVKVDLGQRLQHGLQRERGGGGAGRGHVRSLGSRGT